VSPTTAAGDDTRADIRNEWSDAPLERRREMLAQAVGINDRLSALVRAKQGRLQEMLGELEEKAERYRRRGRELAAPSPGSRRPRRG
jgi:hypothetical protein